MESQEQENQNQPIEETQQPNLENNQSIQSSQNTDKQISSIPTQQTPCPVINTDSKPFSFLNISSALLIISLVTFAIGYYIYFFTDADAFVAGFIPVGAVLLGVLGIIFGIFTLIRSKNNKNKAFWGFLFFLSIYFIFLLGLIFGAGFIKNSPQKTPSSDEIDNMIQEYEKQNPKDM